MRRHDDLELVLAEFIDGEERLVFPGDQDVADPALREGRRRAAGARVEHRHVPVELAEEIRGRRLAAARLLERPGIGRQVVPARAARGLRVGRDHRDARPREVAPVLDLLGVALADEEHDRRGVRRAVVRQARLPVRRQELALLRERVDVVGERERHDVGLQAVDDRARLLAGAAVRLLDLDDLAGLLLPVRDERGVVVRVQLARRVIRHVQERRFRRTGARDEQHRAGRDAGDPAPCTAGLHDSILHVQKPTARRSW